MNEAYSVMVEAATVPPVASPRLLDLVRGICAQNTTPIVPERNRGQRNRGQNYLWKTVLTPLSLLLLLFRAFLCLFVAIGMLRSHHLTLVVYDELCEIFSARDESDG
jgi:hypothetical protein